MLTRRFGRTGHMSTVAIFGAAAFWEVDQAQADASMELVIRSGINHVDVAPSYGHAEERLAPWMEKTRDRFFLGCKTLERTREGAAAELRASLKRLRVSSFDLYQIHAITTMQELDAATGKGAALDAMRDAREAGLIRHIGITGHGIEGPRVFLEALRRFDFDSILFPINPRLYANAEYREGSEELLRECRARDVATMIIKAVGKGPWGERPKTYTTWYEPFADPEHTQQMVNFALSQPVSALCTAGDTTILPMFLEACEKFQPMDAAGQEALIASEAAREPIWA